LSGLTAALPEAFEPPQHDVRAEAVLPAPTTPAAPANAELFKNDLLLILFFSLMMFLN
jgi:hypothetical protein